MHLTSWAKLQLKYTTTESPLKCRLDQNATMLGLRNTPSECISSLESNNYPTIKLAMV